MKYHAQEMKDRIISRWNRGGITTTHLAEQFSISKDAVCGLLRRARKAGILVRLEFPEGTAFGRKNGPSAGAQSWNGLEDTALANACGVKPETVGKWRHRGVPARRIQDVAILTDLEKDDLIR